MEGLENHSIQICGEPLARGRSHREDMMCCRNQTGPAENTPDGNGGIDYRQGTPSITSPGLNPGTVRQDEGLRTGIRIHGPGLSTGCVACSPGEQMPGMPSAVENMMNTHGLKIDIKDVCCHGARPSF